MDTYHHHELGSHSPEEAEALLKYMADHTRHHNEELHDIAHSLGGEAEKLILSACLSFDAGIEKLGEALKSLKSRGE